ncbi:alpha/beta fold hydrolase [Bdellovibrio sp. 22V]|uniref:alpha/beta hydrolase n=1 Tax=Bdellovibrio sp. 22V TaxID=3044166 RepID=UPI002543CBED|nr:alpha/beta fold hydrolase [Bdellovibrio sp. 22V]WII70872.1 alpha/beta fold hydrolase [Bdellovibrio sp. 22V]
MTVHSLEFTERMAGHIVAQNFTLNPAHPLSRTSFQEAEISPHHQPFEFTLTISVQDVNSFIRDPELQAAAFGTVASFAGKNFSVEEGHFNLFTRPSVSPDLDTAKEMHYRLYLQDTQGKDWTFYGFKEILKEDGFEAWSQTTTLYFYLWEGHSDFKDGQEKKVHGLGILHISVGDFIKQLGTFKTNADSPLEEQSLIAQFLNVFAANLWQAYAPFMFTTTSSRWNEHLYPLHTTQGVALGEKTLHPLDTADGLTISVQRFKVKESKKVVLLLHGLTTSTDMYIMPEHQNLVNYLHAHGFTDVWSLDWRGSGRFTYNLIPHRYTIDDIAKNDVPRAVEFIRQKCGEDVEIHVICHCVGSLAFMASLAAGHVKNIKSVISNSVSLTPKVRWQGFLKLLFGPTVFEHLFGYAYISPRMPYLPGPGFGKWIYWMERLLRKECKEPACHLVSFMWGWGFPAAYSHRNMHPITHRRLVDLFGGTSFHYYRHIRKMLFAKASISYEKKNRTNYLEEMKKRKDLPPILLMSGSENHIFPGSNKETYAQLREHHGKVRYLELPHYGHQDVFMGQYCHIEVFPKLVAFLKEQGA